MDKDNFVFLSGHPIDKIVKSGEITIANSGNTTASGNGGGDQAAYIVETSVPNTYGRAGLIRAIWTTDDWATRNSLDAVLWYSYTITFTDVGYTSPPILGLSTAISIGADESSIYFRTANGIHGDVVTTTAAPITSGYTPTSKTFKIKYWMYERE